ncbi:MAG: glycoside hydrolase family 3 protein [Fibrobacteraceae bacterium]|nr:glycoside hydrolase family 3 protein [Fibrobacteraceae bacterium]
MRSFLAILAFLVFGASVTLAKDQDSTKLSALDIASHSGDYLIPTEIRPLWDSLSLREKVGQMIMVYLPHPAFIIQHQFGGVLVFSNHLKNPEVFTDNIKRANDSLKIPLLVATDQEGGRVNRLSKASEKYKNLPSAYEMRAMSDSAVFETAKNIGQALYSLGINVNLAPVLDPALDAKGKKSFMEESHRSWLLHPDSNSRVMEFVKGMKESKVVCTSKHFPGYDSWTNSDHNISVSATPKKKIRENIRAFAQMAGETPLVMMNSVRYISISNRPAVFEPKIVKMAREISDSLVIITDDLWGASLRTYISGSTNVNNKYPTKYFKREIQTAIMAGNDMLMITHPTKAAEIIDFLEVLGKNYPKYRKRIEQSSARIVAMKYANGILNSR